MVPGKRLRNLGGTFRLCQISVEVKVAHTNSLSLLFFSFLFFLFFRRKIWRSFFDRWYWFLIPMNLSLQVSFWYIWCFLSHVFFFFFYQYSICRALLRRKLECSCLTGLGLMEWGCPAKCDQKRTPVVQGCDGRSSGMSLDEDLWDGVQPPYTSLLGVQWWDKLLGVTWLPSVSIFTVVCSLQLWEAAQTNSFSWTWAQLCVLQQYPVHGPSSCFPRSC